MFWADDNDKGVFGDFALGQRRFIDITFDKTDIGRPAAYRIRYGFGIADGQVDFNAGILVMKFHQKRRQPVTGNRLTGINIKLTTLHTAKLG